MARFAHEHQDFHVATGQIVKLTVTRILQILCQGGIDTSVNSISFDKSQNSLFQGYDTTLFPSEIIFFSFIKWQIWVAITFQITHVYQTVIWFKRLILKNISSVGPIFDGKETNILLWFKRAFSRRNNHLISRQSIN